MLEFNEETHTYYWFGEVVPGVSQILEEVGLIQKGYFTLGSAERGKAVHLACQYLDEGDLDWDSLDSEILPYVKGYEKFLRETGFKPELIEERVFNEHSYYAGTLDRTGILSGEKIVLDIKTSSQITKTVGLQLAAYADCLEFGSLKRYAIQLTKDSNYNLILFADKLDFGAWSSAVEIYHWKKTRRKREPKLKAVNE